MATFQVVISDPSTGQSWQKEVEGQDANRFVGRDIGEEVDGGAVGLDEFTLEITGGSDEAGRPLRPDVKGPGLKDVLLEGGPGFKPTRDGERKRVSVRGREISDVVAQLNVSVVDGEGHVGVALGEVDPEDVEETETEADESVEEDTEADEESETEAEEAAEAEEATEDEAEAEAEDEESADTEEAEAEDADAEDEESAEAEAEDEADEDEEE